MINVSDKLEAKIRKEIVRLLILKSEGKSTAYTIGAINAFNKVIVMCDELDTQDIIGMEEDHKHSKAYKSAMSESIFYENYEEGKLL